MTTEGLAVLFAWLEYLALIALLAWCVLRHRRGDRDQEQDQDQ